jgi:hypothetical protein
MMPANIVMRRQTFDPTGDDDSVPVMVPRNLRALVPTSPARVRRLRRHLLAVMRGPRTPARSEESECAGVDDVSGSPVRPEPDGFAARVARAACALCEGWCCKNGADDGFLDERTVARVLRDGTAPNARAVIRLYSGLVPEAGYLGSCIFHGRRGCTLDRSMRSDVCNAWFCGGLHDFLANDAAPRPVTVIAGEHGAMRVSPLLTP